MSDLLVAFRWRDALDILLVAGKFDEAIRIYRDLVRGSPDNAALLLNLAITEYKAAIAIDPNLMAAADEVSGQTQRRRDSPARVNHGQQEPGPPVSSGHPLVPLS